MNKLKQRWGIHSNFQVIIILLVFSITGSAAVKLAGPVLGFFGVERGETFPLLYWCIRILLIFPLYQVLLVAFGWLFGQFDFFWKMEKKMLKRIGLGFVLNSIE